MTASIDDLLARRAELQRRAASTRETRRLLEQRFDALRDETEDARRREELDRRVEYAMQHGGLGAALAEREKYRRSRGGERSGG
jgi:anti-sigma factor RsiW